MECAGMNYRCKACGAHVEKPLPDPENDALNDDDIMAAFFQCPYCGEHELTSIEGEDAPR